MGKFYTILPLEVLIRRPGYPLWSDGPFKGKTAKAIKTFTFARVQVITFLIFRRRRVFAGEIARDGQMAKWCAHESGHLYHFSPSGPSHRRLLTGYILYMSTHNQVSKYSGATRDEAVRPGDENLRLFSTNPISPA
jgi:hypothetical protein